MTKLKWDQVGEHRYETGVDHGVLYLADNAGVYNTGVAWNGLTTITESPSGAESNKQYADNIVYADIRSAELFGATIEAFTYPNEFEQCDGTAVVNGVRVGQQGRRPFGLCYRTRVGNDLNPLAGYKLHLVYGATAAPSEKTHTTVNDSPELAAFSWEISTVPVEVPNLQQTSTLTIDSTTQGATNMTALEDILFGTAGADPRLPLPAEVFAIFGGSVTDVETVDPAYNATTKTITIPAVTGVVYEIDGSPVSGAVVITEDTVVNAHPAGGYSFTGDSDDSWTFRF